jgi:ribonucleotide monophosphatase NagD (HAD superfamily)
VLAGGLEWADPTDLDGTVYLGDELLPGAKETLGELKRLSRVVCLTNKPLQTPANYAAKLTRLGVEISSEEVVSSTDALLLYLEGHAPEARLFAIGEPPLIRLLEHVGCELVQEAKCCRGSVRA